MADDLVSSHIGLLGERSAVPSEHLDDIFVCHQRVYCSTETLVDAPVEYNFLEHAYSVLVPQTRRYFRVCNHPS